MNIKLIALRILCFFFIICLFLYIKDYNKNKQTTILSVEDIKTSIGTPYEINFTVTTNDGDNITTNYSQDEITFEVEDDTIISIQDNTITALRVGETYVKMQLYHNEGTVKGKKEVVVKILETSFKVSVVQ